MLKTLRNRLFAASNMSRISVVVSPMVIVTMVSESGMEAGGLEVEMDDKLE